MFNGRNILSGFPQELKKVVNFLNEKADKGEFVFSDFFEEWANKEEIIKPLNLKYEGDSCYYAASLAYIASENDGIIKFPKEFSVWRWAWSLRYMAPFCEWTPTYIKSVILSFMDQEDDIKVLMNEVAQFYAEGHFDNGLSLLSIMPEFRCDILSGLMVNNLERYSKEFPVEKDIEEFYNVFEKAVFIKEGDVRKAFDIAMPLYTPSPTAMSFFLKAHRHLDDTQKDLCEKMVINMLEKGDTLKYVAPYTKWMRFIKEESVFIENSILLLIQGLGKENSGALKLIDKALWHTLEDMDFIEKIVICIAEHLSPFDVLKMEQCLHHYYDKKVEFLNMVLFFIINPKGEYRIVGRRLWDDYHLELSDFNIMEQEEIIQCAFIVSMLQDFGNPETRLPKILPLLKSKSKMVHHVLSNYLKHYLDDYMGHVINEIDKLKFNNKKTKTIKKYFESRADIIRQRRNIKELSSKLPYYRVFTEAVRTQNEYHQNQMKEAENRHKNTLQELASTVVLARGREWRRPDGTSQRLPKITFSMPARQLTQSYSPMEQAEYINNVMKDWSYEERDN